MAWLLLMVSITYNNKIHFLVKLEVLINKYQIKGKKNCNCKNSRCLKLYCECFSSGEYCKNCNCNGCCNNIENESIRKKTIAEVLERNPNAFRPKIATTINAPPPASPMA